MVAAQRLIEGSFSPGIRVRLAILCRIVSMTLLVRVLFFTDGPLHCVAVNANTVLYNCIDL